LVFTISRVSNSEKDNNADDEEKSKLEKRKKLEKKRKYKLQKKMKLKRGNETRGCLDEKNLEFGYCTTFVCI
jgi:hypothetical protein